MGYCQVGGDPRNFALPRVCLLLQRRASVIMATNSGGSVKINRNDPPMKQTSESYAVRQMQRRFIAVDQSESAINEVQTFLTPRRDATSFSLLSVAFPTRPTTTTRFRR
ncbi:hypothetical protein T11_13811 [Trichinella zimbabwensis]|uniref:Uncharacterized protein n=1 Tax=Trichinella zimbabwensis TaxID=268475 RepID=A0A0V1GZV8_9BILA|nr:hypothetical protein T11_13811 [Trichinella zimbabwensis]